MDINNNVFSLDQYIKEKYHYKYETLDQLLTKSFIEYESTGSNALFWITIDNEKYLFKEINGGEYSWLGELLSKEFADILGIPCAEYRLCKLGNKYGILSKKFTKKNETIILGAQIIQEVLDKYPYLKEDSLLEDTEFLELYNIPNPIIEMERKHRLKYLYNNLNNLEQLWSIIEIYLDLNKKGKENLDLIMDYLVQIFMFDLLTLQADRNIGNWGIIKNQDSGAVTVPPLFDNNASFNLWDLDKKIKNFYLELNNYLTYPQNPKIKEIFINVLYKDRMLLTPSEDAIINARRKTREKNLVLLEYFLKYSTPEYISIFNNYIEKLKQISIIDILTQIEVQQQVIIPDNIKKFLTDEINWNLYFLEEKVKNYSKEQGRGINE